MINFKKHIFKISHITDPFTSCSVVSGIDNSGQPFFYLDGFNDPTTVSLTFTLSNVFDDIEGSPMQIGINGNILTEDIPLTLNVAVTPNGGVTYDYEAIVTPLTNYDGGTKDYFIIDIDVNNLGSSTCTDNTNSETLVFGTPPAFSNIILFSDLNAHCPDSNPVSYYIEGGENNWINAVALTTNLSGTVNAPAGYYTLVDSLNPGFGTSRRWDGSTFLDNEVCL